LNHIKADYSLFFITSSNGILILNILYVDNLLITRFDLEGKHRACLHEKSLGWSNGAQRSEVFWLGDSYGTNPKFQSKHSISLGSNPNFFCVNRPTIWRKSFKSKSGIWILEFSSLKKGTQNRFWQRTYSRVLQWRSHA